MVTLPPLDAQITSNKRRTIVLFSLFSIIYGIPVALVVASSKGWPAGPNPQPLLIATGVMAAAVLIAMLRAERIVLNMTSAQEVTSPAQSPQLWNAVEAMSLAAGIPRPKIYISDDPEPNAFAAGRTPEKTLVCATSGLLAMMSKEELEGVMAHEIAHIRNKDTKVMTYATVLVWGITMLAQVLSVIILIAGVIAEVAAASSRNDRSDSNAQGGGIVAAIVGIFILQAFVLVTNLVQLAISRRREFLADATAVQFTRYPQGLIGALQKLSDNAKQVAASGQQKGVLAVMGDRLLLRRAAMSHMYISPLSMGGGAIRNLLSTHPKTEDRIAALRELGGGQ